jgi:hypothetical protein
MTDLKKKIKTKINPEIKVGLFLADLVARHLANGPFDEGHSISSGLPDGLFSNQKSQFG